MNKRLAIQILAAASMALASTAFAETVYDAALNSNHVVGESIDSGLGQLASTYDAREFDSSRVAGEKLDSGLGQLSRADLTQFVR